jgi:hypothetical protein
VEDLVKVLDSADSIMPNAKKMTFERSKDIGGSIFGSLVSWNKSKLSSQLDDFTARYLRNNNLRLLILGNLLTDVSAFEKFMLTIAPLVLGLCLLVAGLLYDVQYAGIPY